MTQKDYTLNLYTSVLDNNTATGYPITEMAKDWRRSIRFQGGFWEGSFTMRERLDILQEIFYVYLGGHIEERSAGLDTWEGYIHEMTLNDDPINPELQVTVAGYVNTINWRFTSQANDTTGSASGYVNDILANDCPFLATRRVATNSLIVHRSAQFSLRSFDEIMRVVSMGDSSNNLWRFYVEEGRRAVYDQVNVASPDYYARGGVIRMRSFETMWNHVGGTYKDENDTQQTLTSASRADSIGRYGRREQELVENNVPATAMGALRDLYLKENAWPWGRPVGMLPNARLYDQVGIDTTTNPWKIRPGVCRDMHYPAGGLEQGSLLSDVRDFIIDEVEASWDENAGKPRLTIKTDLFEESEAVKEYYDMLYADDPENEDEDGDRVDTWRKFKPGHPKWGNLSPEEKKETNWGKKNL